MKDEITSLRSQAIGDITDAKSEQKLNNIKSRYLGKNGRLTQIFKKIKSLPISERKETGALINETKTLILDEISVQKDRIEEKSTTNIDATIPGIKPKTGSLHPVTIAIEEISRIFEHIGFVRARYPEVEWDWFAFESLGFDENHPARDEWETFILDQKPHPMYGPMVLTPHTSSGQVREMQRVGPPVRMVNIAKCYRRQSDVSHVPMFHQFEGLVIDKNISIAHLRGTLDYFAKTFYGEGRTTRIRPYNFPFTEPSFEVDISCGACGGKGCKLCKGGWLEIGGCGMVHPEVLKNGKVDPEVYTGFAFGWGVERVYMVRAGLTDIRQIYSPDLRFLNQF